METNGRVGWGLCERGGQGSTCCEDAEKPVKEKHCGGGEQSRQRLEVGWKRPGRRGGEDVVKEGPKGWTTLVSMSAGEA